ncbi:MAG TPA: HAMP domain-containing sensor histidine kinase, partial [Lachnospiraceae bacterium]|nr:HAMP domain-containing sensor histidine kinase [Lachnospiraceae bacterium]
FEIGSNSDGIWKKIIKKGCTAMVVAIVVLIFTSVFFAARFFLLRRSIREVTEEFRDIEDCYGTNRSLHLAHPDVILEELLAVMNQHISKVQQDRNAYERKEQEIRKEIANISHDLRTPLTSIIGYLDLIQSADTSDQEKAVYMGVVIKRSRNLQGLIEQFYDFSRLNDKSYTIKLEEIDLHRTLCEHVLTYYADFEQKGIEVDVDMEDKPLPVKGDRNAIGRILNNLTGNALKYSRDNLYISLKVEENKAIITFRNLADPLTRDDVEHLFDRFYMRNSARNSQSTGLGLTIAKLLVEAMDGSMEAILDGEWLEIRVMLVII